MDKIAIFKGARLRFISIADEVDGLGVIRWDKSPFYASWEARSTATSEARSFDFVDDVFGVHLKSLTGLFVVACLQGLLHGGLPAFAVDIAENETVLLFKGFFAGLVFDRHDEKKRIGRFRLSLKRRSVRRDFAVTLFLVVWRKE